MTLNDWLDLAIAFVTLGMIVTWLFGFGERRDQ